jgi:ATP-dependent Lon protease
VGSVRQSVNQTESEQRTEKQDRTSSNATKRGIEEIFHDLDGLVGLGKVKKVIRDVIATQKATLVMKEKHGQDMKFSKHLVFTGAPGTGKTTVARYIGELYASINALPGDAFVEVGRADLIGEYIGQTAPKVRAVVERALGGVLFIDEAYSLMPNHPMDYGHEALATLVQLMENHRDNLVVIMAGYRSEMQSMIDSNPGLRSRMTTYIDFPNYTPDELIIIFKNIVSSHNLQVDDVAVKHLHIELENIVNHSGFGNARFVRSVWEHSFRHMATREFADGQFDDNELKLLQLDDVKYACDHLLEGLRSYGRLRVKYDEITRPGIATGMAWTAAGGDILYLEAAMFKGGRELRVTGQLGEVMKESVEAALSCVRNYSSFIGIPDNFFDDYSLHIHAPDGAIPKDGPSAGITLATAIASVATQRLVRSDVAMTGEITLHGKVMKVGGIREKVMGAYRVGIRTVIIPFDNQSDLETVPKSVLEDITVIPAQTIHQVLEHALTKN